MVNSTNLSMAGSPRQDLVARELSPCRCPWALRGQCSQDPQPTHREVTVTLDTLTVKRYTPPKHALTEPEKTTDRVPLRHLVRYFLRLGLLGFGGPVALVGRWNASSSATRSG